MTSRIPLTPHLAATIFAGIPCTDPSHGGAGHRRCKFPRKDILVRAAKGEVAVVHRKAQGRRAEDDRGSKFAQVTGEMVKVFEVAGVGVQRRGGAQGVICEGMGDWELLDWDSAGSEEEEYVFV